MTSHTEHETANDSPPEVKPAGLLAEFASPGAVVQAAKAVREAGYKKIDAHTPFPLHALDEALGIRPTILPWLVLGAGLTGALVGLVGQWWVNAVNYPFVISGKPLWSLPANIPVIFELTILFSAFTAFFAMLGLNRLPRLHSPLFKSPRFQRATNDRFFLFIQADDAKFDPQATRDLLESTSPASIEECEEEVGGGKLPKVFVVAGCVALSLALIPPLLVARARVTQSDKPRWHTFIDMDYQPKFKPQTTSALFADGRSARLPVAGTVSRDQIVDNDPLNRGVEPGGVIVDLDAAPPEANATGEVVDPTPWIEGFPEEISQTSATMKRGRERFDIYCAVCHGLVGEGNGLVAQRATELQQPTWVPPTSLQSEPVRVQPNGKLFNTITHGVRKMPSYGAQIPVEDRWAIIFYIRALQRSQAAAAQDVPADVLETMREL